MKGFRIKEKIWLYTGHAAWHFISIDKKTSKEIRELFSHIKRGWGSLPVTVKVGKTEWNTSIFYDTKNTCYVLPIKIDVRKREKLKDGDIINLHIKIRET